MSKLCLIDGSGFIFRAYHALPPLSTPDGTPVNAVFGFTKILLNLLEDKSIDYISVIFDSSRITFRQDIYPEYKAHRPPAPDDLVPQFPLFREVVKKLNIVGIEKVGYEADDIIATYVKKAKEENIEVCIMSSDKDLMQLVSDKHNVYMFDGLKKALIKEAQVMDKFGVLPNQVIEAQALIGDTADNVPGVKGIGQKGAAKLIEQYGNLENIYENIENITQKLLKEKLIANKELAFVSRKLVTLSDEVPCEIPISELKIKPINPHELCEFVHKLSFTSLSAQLARKFGISLKDCSIVSHNNLFDNNSHNGKDTTTIEKPNSVAQIDITNIAELKTIILELENNRIIPVIYSIDKQKQICAINIFNETQKKTYQLNIAQNTTVEDLFSTTNDFSAKNILLCLKDLLENTSIKKILFGAKQLMHIAHSFDISIKSFDDIAIMSYLLNGSTNENNPEDIIQLLQKELLIEDAQYEENSELSLSSLTNISHLSLDLFYILKEQLIQNKAFSLYENIDKPLCKTLMQVENNGITLNVDLLKTLSDEFAETIALLEKQIYELSQEEFNIASPKQLGEVLFERMGIKGKKNKAGSWKTDASVLQDLSDNNIEIADKLLEYRQLTKLKNTYSDKLAEHITNNSNRIHCTYLQCLTLTARLSSINPNLQNIPTRTQEGKKIRQAFISAPNASLISLDYSQIELRILAHKANVTRLISAFENNQDIHRITASEIFNIPLSEVNAEQRRKAKAINFGIIYGQTQFGLAKGINISREEANLYIQEYYRKYPEILTYMDNAKNYAQKYGYVLTDLNRKCFIKDINSKNYAIRSMAERSAINAPIQGTAADVMRVAINDVQQYLDSNSIDAKILLQIHDELIIETPKDNAEKLALIIQDIMEKVYNNISLKVDYKISSKWVE